MSSELTILPLGGCGEVGLNSTLFDYQKNSILLDCGALLSIPDAPGVARAVPGFEPLFTHDRTLQAVILTHGHEDHIGALPALLAQLDVPVFGTPATIALAKSRLLRDDAIVPQEAKRQIERFISVNYGELLELGDFSIEFVRITHSVPQSAAVVIKTPSGTVIHTGDFRLDEQPWDGKPSDRARFEALGKEGVDLLMSDSTNAEVIGGDPSESEVAENLYHQINSCEGRAIVTLFASHWHRMDQVVHAARRTGRRLALLGRSLERNWALGIEQGILPDDPDLLVMPEKLSMLPRNQVVVLATGAQGERQGGLYRIAMGNDANLRLLPGDKVLFSARTIPGNEISVRKMLNAFSRQGVEVVRGREVRIHASGHARPEEQRELIDWVQPEWFVPVYGERTMLDAHARTAYEAGMTADRVIVIENGQGLKLSQGELSFGKLEEVSRRPVDGTGRMLDWGDIRDRNRIGRTGLLACSFALNNAGRRSSPVVVTPRGISPNNHLLQRLREAVEEALNDPHLISLELIEAAAKRALLGAWPTTPRRAPEVVVHMVRVRSFEQAGAEDGE